MAARAQQRSLGALFLILTVLFAGVASAAAAAHVWVIAGAAAVLALWMASLTWQLLRPRN
jgi:hypothetical protein